MEERKGDARILIISGFIFLSIISGGFLLSLYLILPESQSRYWYPIVGMILVGIPWVFWFLVWLYHCLKLLQSRANAAISSSSNRAPPVTGGSTVAAAETADHDSPAEGQRRVHFAPVVVMGGQPEDGGQREESADNNGHESCSKETINNSMQSRESEVPLRSSISS